MGIDGKWVAEEEEDLRWMNHHVKGTARQTMEDKNKFGSIWRRHEEEEDWDTRMDNGLNEKVQIISFGSAVAAAASRTLSYSLNHPHKVQPKMYYPHQEDPYVG